MVMRLRKPPSKVVSTAVVAGVPVVTIPAAHYAALLTSAQTVAPRRHRFAMSLSPIDRNPELADFIKVRLGSMSVVDIAAACRAVFAAPTPSKSAISRYAARLAAAALAKPEESR